MGTRLTTVEIYRSLWKNAFIMTLSLLWNYYDFVFIMELFWKFFFITGNVCLYYGIFCFYYGHFFLLRETCVFIIEFSAFIMGSFFYYVKF